MLNNTLSRFFGPLLCAGMILCALSLPGATVGPGGYTNSFEGLPVATDWATLSIAGLGGDNYDLDVHANTNRNFSAAVITNVLASGSGLPPTQAGTANWASAGFYLQTRPSGNRATLLMAKFFNQTGTNATEINITYQLTIAGNAVAEDPGKGTHVFYSLSGETNSWINIPSFNTLASNGVALVSTNLPISWTNGGNLYLLWEDDNANAGTDVGYQIDNFFLGVTGGIPPQFITRITSPGTNATLLTSASVTAAAVIENGVSPFTVRFYTNSGVGNTAFTLAGAVSASPYEIPLGNFSPGFYNLYAVTTDNTGTESYSATNTFVAADPIIVSLTAPLDGAAYDNVTSVPASAAFTGGTGPFAVQFYVDNIPNGAPDTSSPYSVNLGALFVGDHAIRAAVTDSRGWVSNSPVAIVHVSGPLGATLTPTNESIFTFGDPVIVTAAVGGGTGPYTATLFTNDQPAGDLIAPLFSANLTGVPAGTYSIFARVTDAVSQQAFTTTNVITILPNPLLVTLITPTNGQSVSAGVAMNLSATAAVGAPLTISNVQFFVGTVSAGIDASAPYSISNVPAQGTFPVYAVVTDSAGRKVYSATNTITATAAPGSNNNFVNAIPLAGPIITATGNNSTASREQGEPFTANNFGGASVWWTWTPTASGLTTIDTQGSEFDTILGVYTGTAINALTLVAANNDYNGNTWSRVEFNAVAGTVYKILVDGASFSFPPNPGRGNIVLNIHGVGGLNILTPANGTIITAGDPVNIVAATDGNFPSPPASRVEFYRNGTLFATSTTEPYSAIYTNVPAGSNTFLAVAYNSLGAPVQSPAVSVFVQRIGITLLSPVEDTLFLNTNPIPVTAWAYLPSGSFSSVEFFVDGVKFGESTTAPFTAIWSNVVSGSHRLTAAGHTTSGETYLSQAVNIGVAGTLMPYATVWKYLDDGSNQGTNWIAPDFNDSAWGSGPAPLGYSDSNGRLPATTNGFGPDANNKFVTTYYRTAMAIDNPSAFSSVTLNIERDDGAIVYLNGAELARFNMPTSAVTSTTFASANAQDDGGTIFTINVDPRRLVAGMNYFAVEIHQDSGNSSDIWFQMQLLGIPAIIHNVFPTVAIVSPTDNSIQVAPTSITVTANASDADGSINRVEFLLDGFPLGVSSNAPYSTLWPTPVVGPHVLTAIAIDDQGGSTESEPVNVAIFDALGSPIAQITSPTNNTIAEGPTNVLITAYAAALDSVTQVDFRVNNVSVGTATVPPYSVLWTAPFGVNELIAVVHGADGKTGTSAPVTVTITIPPTNTIPPTVATQIPLAASSITNARFTNITVVFSERVQNVDASDLLINGLPATGVTGSGSNYIFTFPQQPYGEIEVGFAAGHGITDFGYPSPLPFNELDPSAAWEYDFLDIIPPTIVARTPVANATVTNLSAISVTFSEKVTGVDATDLLLNGVPAFNVTGTGSNFIFDVIQPASGTISVTWATNNGIADLGLTGPPNLFNRTNSGAAWSFTLDSRTSIVQSNVTWKFFKGLSEASSPSDSWRLLAFDDSAWPSSIAPFVYGEVGFTNAANPGTDVSDIASNAYSSIYFRKTFEVKNAAAITNLFLRHLTDDGLIAWINGIEVARYNMAAGNIPFNGGASTTANESGGNSGVPWVVATLTNGPAALVNGTNILAVHVFNVVTNPPSSDFVFNAQLYTFLSDAGVAPPRVFALSPTPGDVFSFSNLVVTFSETVNNVDASDLLINGVPASTVLASGTNTIFEFAFAQPAYGPVVITWAAGHGIVDTDTPPKPFTPSAASYTLVNPNAPIIVAQVPGAGNTITGLTSIAVTFSEPVVGVGVADLLVNNLPAVSISGSGSNYVFGIQQPPYGVVTVRWATNNGIRDLDTPSNDFDRDRAANQWSYALVDPVPRVAIISPASGAFLLGPTNVSFTATATDNDGSIVRVQFFSSGALIGEATAAPYSVTWANVALGAYEVIAVATDNSGISGTSAPVVINLVSELPAFLTRGPYLQIGTPTGGVVRWRTDLFADSVVRYGPAPDALTNVASVSDLTNEHIVTITGLLPDTKYYYSVGSPNRTLVGGTNSGGSNYWFITSPVPGTRKPIRFWALGDSGTANANAQAVRDAYYSFVATNGRSEDLWLMLGDNAYNSGTDDEHQAAIFNMYPDTLRNRFLWPTIGNHETAQSTTASAFPYLDIFSLPVSGEAGGTPSGTEKYYSFDYGNIHFICLDSMTSGRTADTAMAQWLRTDLANSMQEWNIVFFHHPPYTKGSHNSDAESDLVQIRQNLVPILEEFGVDLVLSGHSHCYERSYLLNGHYGLSTVFSITNKVDAGDGREDGSGIYRKNEQDLGVVYTVAGSSGQISGGQLNHPAHFVALNELGSMVIDVTSNRLEARFLAAGGAINDHFTLQKRPNVYSPADLIARAVGSNAIQLTWSDLATNELGYIIERSLDGTNFIRLATNAPNIASYLDSALIPSTPYFYRVRAFVGEGESSATSVANGFTGNRAPSLALVADRIVDVTGFLVITNTAVDLDADTVLTYALGAGAPAGVHLRNTNGMGIIYWRPERNQAASSNVLSIVVTDNGTPAMSATQSFAVVVRDYVELGIGSAVMRVGNEAGVPLNFAATTPVTNLTGTVQLDRARIIGLGLESAITALGSLTLDISPTNGIGFTFAALPGQTLSGTQQIATLRFMAAQGQDSAFVPFTFNAGAATRATAGLAPTIIINSGRATVIATQPLVEATIDGTTGSRLLTLYGIPGVAYTVDRTLTPATASSWQPLQPVTLSELWQTFQENSPVETPSMFYRARQ